MPIAVVCASCGAKMTAPDAAAGKRLKCPKCQAAVVVPGTAPVPVFDAIIEEEEEEEIALDPVELPKPPAPANAFTFEEGEPAPAPQKASVRRLPKKDEDEDDEPAAKPRRRNPLIFVVIGGMVLLFLGGAGTAAWYFGFRTKTPKPATATSKPAPAPATKTAEKPTGPPEGWEFYDEKSEFSVFFPTGAGAKTEEDSKPPDKKADFATDLKSITRVIGEDRAVTVGQTRFTSKVMKDTKGESAQLLERLRKDIESESGTGSKPKIGPITMAGVNGLEFVTVIDVQKPAKPFRSVMRVLVVRDRVFVVSVTNLDPKDEKIFFDSFKLKS